MNSIYYYYYFVSVARESAKNSFHVPHPSGRGSCAVRFLDVHINSSCHRSTTRNRGT